MIETAVGVALATLVLEDAACIAAGVLVSTGKISLGAAAMAATLGIFAGDLALYAIGRGLTTTAGRDRFTRLAAWLRRNTARAILVSRFTPGLRLPAYTAAGWARVPLRSFLPWLALAAILWTPVLVAISALAGEAFARSALLGLPAAALIAITLAALSDWRVRRRWLGRALRWIRWEFWPIWAMYLPLVPYLLYLAAKHRSLTAFLSSNPGMFRSGLTGESKHEILAHLARNAPDITPRFHLVRAGGAIPENVTFPVVAKPDRGERGQGVAVIRSLVELETVLSAARVDMILQEYVPGLEFGILCARRPGSPDFEITSITRKTFPRVTGDGVHTLEEMLLRDARAVCLADRYLAQSSRDRHEIIAAGERVPLVEIGSHSRGSIFLDGRTLVSPDLVAAVDRAAKAHPGFCLGRFDLRAESEQALREGRFRVLELNGVASEPAHIYDPAVSIVDAYRALATHWRLAFEIGAANRRRRYS